MTKQTTTCDAAKTAIAARRFVGWQGLPAGCAPDTVVGVKLDDTWGLLRLGSELEAARSHLLELPGYGRTLAYARDGALVVFDAMTPKLDGDWTALSADLGTPEAVLDWTLGTVPMPKGELVYAKRGITIFLNPETNVVAFVTLYAPTSAEAYSKHLRPSRETKRH